MTSTNEQMALALAALQAGIFPYPRFDDGKQWTHIARTYLFALDEDAQREAVKRLYREPNHRNEAEYWNTPTEALAAAAKALGLQPIYCPPPQQAMVMVPREMVSDWVKTHEETAPGHGLVLAARRCGKTMALKKVQADETMRQALRAALREEAPNNV